jgi:uncharacterized protein YbjT (DUF2867 family)
MLNTVAVTGATGNVGKVLSENLLKKGIKVRAIARSFDKLSLLKTKGAEIYLGDLQNTSFLSKALYGVDAVFAMIPEHPNVADFFADKRQSADSLAKAIKESGVSRVIALSAIGVNPPSGIGPSVVNGEFEEMLKNIPGLSVVALRAAFLMENHFSSIQLIKNTGINGGAVRSDVSLPMIATHDIASAATEYFLSPTFNEYYVQTLLGPRDYTFREATSILGEAIGKPDLAYVEFPYEDFRKGLVGAGFSSGLVNSLIELFTAFNEGQLQRNIKRDASNTTKTTLEEFAREIFAPVYRENM